MAKAGKPAPPRPRRGLLRRLAFLLVIGASAVVTVGVGIWLSLPDVAFLEARNPQTTALIEQRSKEAHQANRPFKLKHTWVRLDGISPKLIAAVTLSEDARFFQHGPFDWKEMEAALEKDVKERKFARGASTLTQQLAKNLFFGTEKTLTRKLREGMVAVKLERGLTKRRILALYLNVAEWGEDVFGAEAAARKWFGVSAKDVDAAQAAILAAMLPAPRKASLAPAPRWLEKKARHVLDLMLEAKRLDADEHASASARLEKLLAGGTGGEEEPADDEE